MYLSDVWRHVYMITPIIQAHAMIASCCQCYIAYIALDSELDLRKFAVIDSNAVCRCCCTHTQIISFVYKIFNLIYRYPMSVDDCHTESKPRTIHYLYVHDASKMPRFIMHVQAGRPISANWPRIWTLNTNTLHSGLVHVARSGIVKHDARRCSHHIYALNT